MPSIATKTGGGTFIDWGDFPRIGPSGGGSGKIAEETQAQLRRLAREVIAGISEMDASHREELLGAFVLELVFLGKEQEYREKRRRKQAERAKATAAHAGRQPRALPEGFEELRQAWRKKEISLRIAAEACGLPQSTFYNAALRAESAARAD